jgi:DNA replication protein DnaC
MSDLELATEELQQQALHELKYRVRTAPYPLPYIAGAFGLPMRYRNKNIRDLDQRYASKVEAAVRATRAGHNVLIFGGIGSGKTHLAACLLWDRWKDLVDVGFDIWREPALLNRPEQNMKFVSTSDIITELKAAKTTWKREDEILDRYSWTTVMVMDDLGFEERSELVRSWLSTILDRRYRGMKQTIITTNLTPKDLADAVDDRVTSRLIENGLVVHMDGPDYRRKMAEDNKRNVYQPPQDPTTEDRKAP